MRRLMLSRVKPKPIESWDIFHERPLIISGPCAAESRKQVLSTARALAGISSVRLFRAGIWKPRTRPGGFEGAGSGGFDWLKEAEGESGLPVITEVANAGHAMEAIENGLKYLWIGARTTGDPFAVQDIANALAGLDVTVFIKNPISPEPDLWIGAMERIYNAGIKKIAAVHRGFCFYGEQRYRNPPFWEIPLEIKRKIPGLPIICDPSHIAGNTSLIAEIAKEALKLNYDGLMIESHSRPADALSDAEQQISPDELEKLLFDIGLGKKRDSKSVYYIKTKNDFKGAFQSDTLS